MGVEISAMSMRVSAPAKQGALYPGSATVPFQVTRRSGQYLGFLCHFNDNLPAGKENSYTSR